MKSRILILGSLVLAAVAAHAQTDSTIHVKAFPGNTIGQLVTEAMATCTPVVQVPCILLIDPSLATMTVGTMPTLCSHCYLSDFRAGVPGSYALPIATPSTLGGIKPDNTTIQVNSTTGIASAVGGSGALPAYNPTAALFFGDSITACAGVTTPGNCYPNQIASFLAMTGPTNDAVSGDQACDTGAAILNHDAPAIASKQPWRSVLIGTNDANHEHFGPYEATFTSCLLGDYSWETVPGSFKVAGSAATVSGTCANDTTFSAVTGENCTSSGATLTFSLATGGGPVYFWIRSIDSDAGTWNYKIDGGSVITETTALATPMATQNGRTTSMILLRATGVSAGTHSIIFTKTNGSGNMPVLAVGTVPFGVSAGSLPYLVAGDLPNQLNGTAQTDVNAYRVDTLADIALLQGDGLELYHAPVGTRVQAVTAAGDMADGIHLNDAGHVGELYPAFQTPAKLISPLAVLAIPNSWGITYQTGSYTATSSDGTILAACASNPCTITIPSFPANHLINVINIDGGGPVTVAPGSGTQVILRAVGQGVGFTNYLGGNYFPYSFGIPTENQSIVKNVINAPYTLQNVDAFIATNNTSAYTITFPAATWGGVVVGQTVTLIAQGAATNVAAGAGATITGPTSLATNQAATWVLQPGGLVWLNVSSNLGTAAGTVAQNNCLTTACAGGSTYSSAGGTYTNLSGAAVWEEITATLAGSSGTGGQYQIGSTVGGVAGPAAQVANACGSNPPAFISFKVPAGASFTVTPSVLSTCSPAGTWAVTSWLETN